MPVPRMCPKFPRRSRVIAKMPAIEWTDPVSISRGFCVEPTIQMKRWAGLALSMLLAACASVPATEPPQRLFNDDVFLASSERIHAEDVFAISAEMKSYLETEFARGDHGKDRRRALFDALYKKGGLKLEYDLATTRNAAQTFEARSGNCLSLVIMTAAFAKEMGLPVRYQ